ncbi:MAG: hypothetical protein A2452_08190 [Candidatus Firestonebacteria bacterium RIFOXYC2_FULL_39_67]|nr:MAG: hypothetical protein A2536_01350 [Candidatus Firestonebacteria bacterium RIFOXYD2_FULL_39_29]OGF53797.1 MAG: hypothetical protein A2452_08190 [Candidatus Firestonebacteria bacterium RIFOXYC2_FULL_39_67]OGF57381.1 MAG: hypothetical protein A2497_05175 [Candidatus Firestonebacteria bacterium RifOxyC12_full_39_7]
MKKTTLKMCALFAASFILSACSKSPVGPSMSSMSIGANAASSSSSSSTICVTSNSGGSTSVNTQQTSTVSTQLGDTSVANVNVFTGVSSGITGGGSSASASGNGSATNTGSTLNLTFHTTLVAAIADIQVINISSSTIPTFSINYSGISGSNLFFMVNDATTEHYMNVLVPSLPTSIRFGVTPTGGTENVPSKTLIAGTYSVVATISDSSDSTKGYAYGTLIVQ